MSIRVYLTGPLAIEVDGKTVVDEHSFRGRQSRLAFAYLAVERTRHVGREELAEVIWPHEMPPAWTGALSALISRLKGLFTTAGLDASGMFISSDFGLYRLTLPADAWVDLEAAAAGIDRAEAALRAGDAGRVLSPATITSNICRRPFLADCDGDWVESLRGKLVRQLVRALEIHTRMWLSSGEAILAVETAMEATTLDPFRETAYQLLMRAYVASGNPAQASGVYQRLQALLSEELNAAPSSETQALYHQLSS